MATILAGTSYFDLFSTPRTDRYDRVQRSRMLTGRRVWGPLQALSLRTSGRGFDLLHSFNMIPLGVAPYIVSFEGELPRAMDGAGRSAMRRLLRGRLLSERCRGLYPISRFATRLFARACADWPLLDRALARCQVVYPNVPLRRSAPRRAASGTLRLVFIGNEWARKGGAACARMLPLLRQKRIPFTLDVVSGLAHGERVYTDTGADFYARDLGRLDAGEVRVHGPMRNADVLRLIEASDLCLLPTLDDSFGFSLLESMSCAVPVIATAVCAIPEIVDDGADGVLLPLPTDGDGRWRHVYAPRDERLSPRHRSLLDTTLDGLARGLAGAIERLLDRELDYERLSQGAIDKVRSRFEMGRQAERWHAIYRACIGPSG